MIDRLDGLQSVPDAPSRSIGKENASRGDFEQTLKELEERDPHTTHGPQTDSERETSPDGNSARRLEGEGTEVKVEALLLPWQLISQATLSQLTRLGAVASQATSTQRGDVIGTHAASSGDVLLHGPASLPTATHLGNRELPMAQPWYTGSVPDAVRKSEEVGASRLSMSGLANPWSERLVRWISDPGQRVTAWVRDYGLESTDMPALIRDLLEHASGQSVQLARIVVNGQECWNVKKPLLRSHADAN